jgi:alpha-methylacyl-CoA racemase
MLFSMSALAKVIGPSSAGVNVNCVEGFMAGPLSGVRIVELSSIGPAPFCAMLLADLGAEVLRIKPPALREPVMPIPEADDPIWRGRGNLTLDLKNPDDLAKLKRILRYADILIEGFRPGVLERLGLGPEVCLHESPRLVVGRVTGWGQDGPLAKAPCHDPNILALTGVLHSMGYADRPPLPPLNIVGDFGGGALYLVMGLLAGLLHARATGAGQVVDVSMLDAVASLMGPVYAMRNHGLWSDERGMNALDGSCPFARCYETADGKYVVVAALEPQFYQALLQALEPLIADPLPDRNNKANWPALHERFAAIFKTKTRDEWARLLEGAGACVSPVLNLAEAQAHPQLRSRKVFASDPPLPAAAPRFSLTPSSIAPRDLGSVESLLDRWASR